MQILDGYREKSGRGKMGWYKGFYCNSSWELAYIIWALDHNLNIIRNKQSYSYIWKNKTKKYYPDFLIDDFIIEIKGYNTLQFQEKIKQFKTDKFVVYYKDDMKTIIAYVIEKYGKNYINLYETFDKS